MRDLSRVDENRRKLQLCISFAHSHGSYQEVRGQYLATTLHFTEIHFTEIQITCIDLMDL